MTYGETQELVKEFNNSGDKLILLDYDGTLVDYDHNPSKAILPAEVKRILERLKGNPDAKTYIITGRGHEDIENMLCHLDINIIAEHGAIVKENGLWRNELVDNKAWKSRVIIVMEKNVIKCPGSFIEEKEFSVAWHYRKAEEKAGYECSRELIRELDTLTGKNKMRILDGKKVVEVLSRETGKGTAVSKILNRHFYNFVLSIGDDVTDEEMFEYSLHHTNAVTIKVGDGSSLAKYRLQQVSEVVSLLKQLSE